MKSPADYVYGVVAAGTAAPPGPGIDGATLRLVSNDEGIAALVSDVEPDDLRFGRDAMLTHAKVLEQALTNGTVLPTRFGLVMAGDRAVRQTLLDPHLQTLRAQLDEFADTVELKLRATYDERQLMGEIVSEDQEIARLRDSLRDTPEDATYYARIRLGELVAEAVQRKRQVDSARIIDWLATLALAVDEGEADHERLVFNASFLIARGRIAEFDATVDDVGREEAGRMRFKYTGPLPPHSFVSIEMGA